MDGSTQAPLEPVAAEPAAAVPGPEKKKRPPYATIFTFVAASAGMLQYAHEILEKSEHSIEATADAFRQVDLFGLAGSFIDGLRLYPVSYSAGWAYPWETLFAGLHGMWSAVTAGGTSTILAGIAVLAIGISLIVFAFSQTERTGAVAVTGKAILFVLGLITVIAVGIAANALVAATLPDSGFGGWVATRNADLGTGFGYATPTPPPALTFTDRINQLTQAAPAPQPGHYAHAAPVIGNFLRENPWFGLETLLIGIVACCIIGVLAKLSNGVAATFFIPFGAIAIVTLGAAVAYVIDHAIVITFFMLLLKIISISALPVGLGAVAFILEKGHLGLSFLESSRKLTGHD